MARTMPTSDRSIERTRGGLTRFATLLLVAAATTLPPLDVGIVLSGRFDRRSGRLDFAWEHRAVVEALAADGASFATAFCYPMSQVATAAGLESRPGLGLHIVLTQANATIVPSIRSWYPMQFQRLDQCFLALEAWGRRRGRLFSHFIRLRPDATWDGPMPRVSALPLNAISLRARQLYANYTLSDFALSWNTRCMKRQDCGAATFNDRQSHRPCVVPDDQWAVIPAHLAPVYFNTSRRSTPPPKSHGSSPSSTLPLTVTAESPGPGAPARARATRYRVFTVSSSSRPPRCAAPGCHEFSEMRNARGELVNEGYLANRLHASDAKVRLAVVEAPLRLVRYARGQDGPMTLEGKLRSCNVECATEWEREWWTGNSERLKAQGEGGQLWRPDAREVRMRTERCAAAPGQIRPLSKGVWILHPRGANVRASAWASSLSKARERLERQHSFEKVLRATVARDSPRGRTDTCN